MPAPPELSDPAIVSAIAVRRGRRRVVGHFDPSLRMSVCNCLGVKNSSIRASAGTFSIIQVPNQLSPPVRIRTPVKIRSTPIAISTRPKCSPEALEESQKGTDGNRGQDERNAEPERIDEQQPHAGAEARLVRRQRQHGRQHRADARRPAERKSEAHHIGSSKTGALPIGVDARLPIEQGHAQHAQKVQAENDDDEAGHDRELVLVRLDPLTEHRRAGAEAYEHRGEPQHEEDGRQNDTAPQSGVDLVLVAHLIDGRAAEIAEIRRHERQHAGRQKAHQARKRHAEMDVNLGQHQFLPPPAVRSSDKVTVLSQQGALPSIAGPHELDGLSRLRRHYRMAPHMRRHDIPDRGSLRYPR